MPKFKGTQGKWKVTESKFGQVGYVASENGQTLASIYAETNAPYTSYSNKDHEELLANTKLIAAAPEMFEMLKECLEFAEKVQSPATPALFLRKAINELLTKMTE